ncbi:hypothetical protein LTR37_011416 [Vermiconidia calcicola]|uniref:Uncharacterized protein n=1 Tax=Vermiconidia calcicola TaxID=1690605 RepID=A0ACC3N214_9PEZI|nr:hypothetical protein LTR37_011416 [Vermiconidia calcicola]
MSYTYDGLRADEFRLLEPISGLHERDLCFRIRTFRREHAPPYTAVSYTWGDASASQAITINDRDFRVRPNLWACLYYLRIYADPSVSTWKHIWVDAICINQNDTQERSSQVLAMRDIYMRACTVSVWLDLIYDPKKIPWHEEVTTIDNDRWDWVEHLPDLANKAYWTRRWVVQEFLLARQIDYYCSGHRMDELLFRDHVGDVLGEDLHAVRLLDDSLPFNADGHFKATALVAARGPDAFPELARPLQQLLVQHRQANCKEPKDRVFALLGLLPQEDRQILSRFFPDYELSLDDVLITTLSFLRGCSNVTITVDSHDLFEGLGVKPGYDRARLLRYSDIWDIQNIAEHGRGISLTSSDLDDHVRLEPSLRTSNQYPYEVCDEEFQAWMSAIERPMMTRSTGRRVWLGRAVVLALAAGVLGGGVLWLIRALL